MLDHAPGPRPRDLPDPVWERPRFMKMKARQLLHQAARLAADASTLGAVGRRSEIESLRDEAHRLLDLRTQKLNDLVRAGSHPATQHTAAAWGAQPGEPLPLFLRALRRTLLALRVREKVVHKLLDTGGQGEGEKGGRKKGKGKGGGRKGKGKG